MTRAAANRRSPAAKIADALQKLPIIPGREADVDRWAREIAKTDEILRTAANLSTERKQEGTAARLLATSPKRAIAELNTLAGRAAELQDACLRMKKTARAALAVHAETKYDLPQLVAEQCHRIVAACDAAVVDLEGARRKRKKQKKPNGPGRPNLRRAPLIARLAALAYSDLTGTRAARGHRPSGKPADGPFVRLLAGVFDALEIKASEQAQARRLSGHI